MMGKEGVNGGQDCMMNGNVCEGDALVLLDKRQ